MAQCDERSGCIYRLGIVSLRKSLGLRGFGNGSGAMPVGRDSQSGMDGHRMASRSERGTGSGEMQTQSSWVDVDWIGFSGCGEDEVPNRQPLGCLVGGQAACKPASACAQVWGSRGSANPSCLFCLPGRHFPSRAPQPRQRKPVKSRKKWQRARRLSEPTPATPQKRLSRVPRVVSLQGRPCA